MAPSDNDSVDFSNLKTRDQMQHRYTPEITDALSQHEEEAASSNDEISSVDGHSTILEHSSNSGSILSRLPAEIRMELYKKVMPSRVKIISCFSYDKGVKGPVRFWVPDEEDVPSAEFRELAHMNILQASKLINREIGLLPYQHVLFDLGDIRDAMMFFNTLSFNKLANIRRIRIECKLGSLHYTGRMDWGYHQEWIRFCVFVLWALSDLRELHIDLLGWGHEEHIVATGYSLEDYNVLLEILDLSNPWVQALGRLEFLTLSKVDIVPDNNGKVNPDRGVEELRVAFAKTLARKLLRQ